MHACCVAAVVSKVTCKVFIKSALVQPTALLTNSLTASRTEDASVQGARGRDLESPQRNLFLGLKTALAVC